MPRPKIRWATGGTIPDFKDRAEFMKLLQKDKFAHPEAPETWPWLFDIMWNYYACGTGKPFVDRRPNLPTFKDRADFQRFLEEEVFGPETSRKYNCFWNDRSVVKSMWHLLLQMKFNTSLKIELAKPGGEESESSDEGEGEVEPVKQHNSSA